MKHINTPPSNAAQGWLKNSVTAKLVTIILLALLLLIPSSMVTSIIKERERLNQRAIDEVSAKWAGSQQINGPILTIPVLCETGSGSRKKQSMKYWHILPEELKIDGAINPEKLKRSLYEVVVYKSNLSINGSFIMDLQMDQKNFQEIQFDKSFLTIGLSDLKGIEDEIDFKWGNQTLKVEPGTRIPELIYSGITIPLQNLENTMNKKVDFQFSLNLQGSQNMTFVPIGSTTEVSIHSSWASPSFNGDLLPDQRDVSSEGFKAKWKILQLNRNFPQNWLGPAPFQQLNEAVFGVNLILPLDDYQKSMRSAKYAIMTIALTFLIFFLVEVMNQRKIHAFQYTLVGLALCLFYILLVSISEHLDFNIAYAISSGSVITMITLYAISVFRAQKLTFLLLTLLCGIYGFLYVTLQMEDYALLMGSIGLTLILAATMYFTRNINWYRVNTQVE